MSIEEKIKELGIKKVLIADDTKENIDAAKQYFENEVAKYGISFIYVSSGEEAITKIKEEFDKAPNKRFDLVISDMDMEKENIGINVFYEAWLHGTPCLIATGKTGYVGNDAGMSQSEMTKKGLSGHGDTTRYYGLPVYEDENTINHRGDKSLNSKREVECWKHTFAHALDYLSRFKNEKIPETRKTFFEGIVYPENIPLDKTPKKCLDFIIDTFNKLYLK